MKRFSLFALSVIIVLIAAGCARPPETQIQQATAAYQAAEAAGAPKYAPDTWSRARQAMDRLKAELDTQGRKSAILRSYGRARALAEETIRVAKQAAAEAGTRIEQLAGDVTAAIAEVRSMLQTAQNRLSTLPRIRGLDPAALRAQLGAAGQQLEQAEADRNAGRFDEALASASQARDTITEVLRAIERAVERPAARKR